MAYTEANSSLGSKINNISGKRDQESDDEGPCKEKLTALNENARYAGKGDAYSRHSDSGSLGLMRSVWTKVDDLELMVESCVVAEVGNSG